MEFLSLGMLGIFAAAGVACAPLMLLALAIPYAIARLRTDGPVDPQLGLKVALYFFISASMLLALSGATLIAADLLARDAAPAKSAEEGVGGPPVFSGAGFGRPISSGGGSSGFNVTCRVGVALMISGIIGWIAHHLMLKRTTAANQARVHRTFVGFRFAIAGLTLCGAVTLLIVLMLQENAFVRPSLNSIRSVIGVVIVWLPAWLLHLGLMFQASRGQVREAASPA